MCCNRAKSVQKDIVTNIIKIVKLNGDGVISIL